MSKKDKNEKQIPDESERSEHYPNGYDDARDGDENLAGCGTGIFLFVAGAFIELVILIGRTA